MRRLVRSVAVSAVAAVVTTVLHVAAPLPASADPITLPGSAPTEDYTRPDLVSAQVLASATGHRVEVTSERTESTTTFVETNGTLTMEAAPGPVRVRRGDGWVPLDTTLELDATGVHPRAVPDDVVFGGAGSTTLATLTGGSGGVLTMGWTSPLPAPLLSGDTVTYPAALPTVLPGADLKVRALRSGFEQSLLLNVRPLSAPVIRIPLELGGLRLSETADGDLRLVDLNDVERSVSPAPLMWGATTDAMGDPTRIARVDTEVVQGAGGSVDLILRPDPAFLADPTVTLPITVDPSLHLTQTNDTWVYSAGSNTQGASTELRVGRYSTSGTSRALMKFSTSPIAGRHVLSSTLALYAWAAASCTPKTSQVRALIGSFSDSTNWTNKPDTGTTIRGSSDDVYGASGCNPWWVRYDVTSLAAGWAAGTIANYGLEVRSANESDTGALWRFRSMDTTTASQLPSLAVSYNSYPGKPTELAASPCFGQCTTPMVTASSTPTLKVASTDPDGGSVATTFELWNAAHTTLLQTVTKPAAASGTAISYVPSVALTNGTTYAWRARASDGTDTGAWSNWFSFTVDKTAPNAPTVSSAGFPAGQWSGTDGASGTWSLGNGGSTDVIGYYTGLDQTPPASYATSSSLTLPNLRQGQHTLYVQSVDAAGNRSSVVPYAFNVGDGAITSPATGERTASQFTLGGLTKAAGPYTGWTWQWRRSATDAWTTATGLVDLAGNPVGPTLTVAADGTVPSVRWNAAAQAGVDGPVEITAQLTGTQTALLAPRSLTLDRSDYGRVIATEQVGPASVNLLTGNASLSATDVSVTAYGSDLTVSRTYNSRAPQAGATGPFGPGWVSSVPVEAANADYTGLTVTGGTLVTIAAGDGDSTTFVRLPGGTYQPEVGYEDLTLTYVSASDRYDLADTDGTVTGFTKPAGSTDGTYRPSSVKQAGDPSSTTYAYETVGGVTRVTRVMAPQPPGLTCTTANPNVAGCRSLGMTYAPASQLTPGDTAATWGDYPGRLAKVSLTAVDVATSQMTTIDLAAYAYDSTGRLRAAWDPRLPTLKTTYDYDSAGHLVTLTPPAEEPWTLSYRAAVGDPDTGRLWKVSRSALSAGTATWTLVYGVPVAGSGAPYDLSAYQLDRTGQADRATDATAVFPPTQVPADPATSYERATVHYLNADGREVNTAEPGGGIATTEYDRYGNAIRTLTAGNRRRALDASISDSTEREATLAQALSTTSIYSSDGLDLLETYGPEREITLASGTKVRARVHTVNRYDESAPAGGPYHLLTSSTTGARVAGESSDRDTRTSATQYATTTDWQRRTPTATIEDVGGLALTTRTSYTSDGQLAAITLPGGTSAQNTAHTTKTLYYTAGAHPVDAACGNVPAWVNLVCATLPAAQPTTSASRPALPTTYLTYTTLNQVRTKTEKVGGTVLRTTTTDYDSAGRAWKVTVTGNGTALPTIETVYDPATGKPTETRNLASNGVVSARVQRVFDTLGRITSYTDSDGNVSSMTYDVMSRPLVTNDGKGTQSRSYDGAAERRGLLTTLTDSAAGTFTATYDTDGALTTETYPNGLRATTTYDETGTPTSLEYVKTTNCTTGCTWLSETVDESVHGQWLRHTSTLSSQTYAYDQGGRLTRVEDIPTAGGCTTRVYTVDADSNRTAFGLYGPGADGACQTASGASAASMYDQADRIVNDLYAYDSLGRTTYVPAGDAGGTALTASYYVNDLVRNLSQGSAQRTWTLDVDEQRFRSWTDGTTTRTNHYSGDGDSPAWVAETSSTWTRNVAGISGNLAAIQDSSAGVTLQLANLHGDVIATASTNSAILAPSATFESTEFGAPRNASTTRRYGWLGTKQRSADTLGGNVLMGVRLYLPSTGRFLQIDPVPGGSDSRYDYVGHDPANKFDLDGRFCIFGRSWGRRAGGRCRNPLNAGGRAIRRGATWGSYAGAGGAVAGCVIGGTVSGGVGCLPGAVAGGGWGAAVGALAGFGSSFLGDGLRVAYSSIGNTRRWLGRNYRIKFWTRPSYAYSTRVYRRHKAWD